MNTYTQRWKSLSVRFWEKVNKDGAIPNHMPHLGKCWLWTGMLRNGYGAMKVGRLMQSAHRLSYVFENGEIPIGMLVCHHCDNPICVNPEHLFVGDINANNQDRLKKGGYATGENHRLSKDSTCMPRAEMHGMAKLDWKTVRKIRSRFASGFQNKTELAADFNISRSQIRRIIALESWK